ncbi:MAG: hypothetical protein R2932_21135 [Caldilineaceae bacterium]
MLVVLLVAVTLIAALALLNALVGYHYALTRNGYCCHIGHELHLVWFKFLWILPSPRRWDRAG